MKRIMIISIFFAISLTSIAKTDSTYVMAADEEVMSEIHKTVPYACLDDRYDARLFFTIAPDSSRNYDVAILPDGRVVEKIVIEVSRSNGGESDWWFRTNYQNVETYFAVNGRFVGYKFSEKEWTLSDSTKNKCRSFNMTRDSYSSKNFKTNISICSPAADSMFANISKVMDEKENIFFSELKRTKEMLTASHLRYQKVPVWTNFVNGYTFYKNGDSKLGDSTGKITSFIGFAKNKGITTTIQEIYKSIEYSNDRENFSELYYK